MDCVDLKVPDSLQSVLESISASLCILDQDGTVVASNGIWKELSFDHGQTHLELGDNYLVARKNSVTDEPELAERIVKAIDSVASHKMNHFVCEYPCHGLETSCWYEVSVSRLESQFGGCVVLSHRNITADMSAKFKLQEKTLESDQLAFEAQMQTREFESLLTSIGRSHSVVEYSLDGQVLKANQSFTKLFGFELHEVRGKTHELFCSRDFVESGDYKRLWEKLRRGEFEVGDYERVGKDQEKIWIQASYDPVFDTNGQPLKIVEFASDISEQKKLHKELESASRQAGMAEVATGVLHNVGNVLNSVNVSANLMIEKANKSPLDKLSKAADILNENSHKLAEFLTEDHRGRHFPKFLTEFLNFLQEDRKAQLEELDGLVKNIEHIKEIISVQQSFGSSGGTSDRQNIIQLVEEAIQLNQQGFQEYKIQLHREMQNVPLVTTEKHKVLQILVNLIKNSQQAIRDAENINNELCISVYESDDFVNIRVKDNGIGISEENLKNIFVHGFTTKNDGHGFGLHSCALSAQQLGGELLFQSEGLGYGATFTLRLPVDWQND